MPNLRLEIGGRHYDIHCQDGEEAHVQRLATEVDAKARDAQAAIGGINETRQLLFAALMLADERRADPPSPIAAPQPPAQGLSEAAIDALTARIERIAAEIARG
ncbi:MAG: cell division protein ZapA [Sphingomonadales bacterium]|nr:cell division protein ZapA [Sphingomonadales bacterium]